MTSYLCKLVGVSSSGYYNYFSSKSEWLRSKRNDKDIEIKNVILEAVNFKNRKKVLDK